MAFKERSARPTRTLEDIRKEETFIEGAKADQAEFGDRLPDTANRQSQPPGAASDDSPGQPIEAAVNEAPEVNPEASAGKAGSSKTKKVKSKKEDPSSPRDPYALVKRVAWPITSRSGEPVMAEGRSDIDKQFVMRLKEDLWNSVEQHCTALGIDKSKWVREAMNKQLYEEQQFFLKQP